MDCTGHSCGLKDQCRTPLSPCVHLTDLLFTASKEAVHWPGADTQSLDDTKRVD